MLNVHFGSPCPVDVVSNTGCVICRPRQGARSWVSRLLRLVSRLLRLISKRGQMSHRCSKYCVSRQITQPVLLTTSTGQGLPKWTLNMN